ncbi:MAG TPA: DUF1127 domain-containing protein [Gammaproteobacteria bacterium]|nr:DUF1127 domain-containing protein [Gammaproteobacteria bacterium]HRF44809.1 DUF1127 domain-containing protein [Candidatus Competibacteraceae bacterium]
MCHDAALYPEQSINHHSRIGAILTGVFACLRNYYAVYCQRRDLLALDDAMLKDIGISRVDALQEGNKPFWRT